MNWTKRSVPWWAWIVVILTIALEFILYPHLPDEVAIHFNTAGQPDRYCSRIWATLFGPIMMITIILLWSVLWRLDPKKRNYATFWSTYRYLGGGVVAFIGLSQLWLLGYALHVSWVSARVLPTVTGLLIMFKANLLPRVQPNWLVGIRTPWTLSSDDSWRRTLRLAGNLGIPAGLMMIVLVWVLPPAGLVWAIIAPILLWGVIAVVASYFYARSTLGH